MTMGEKYHSYHSKTQLHNERDGFTNLQLGIWYSMFFDKERSVHGFNTEPRSCFPFSQNLHNGIKFKL